MTYIELFAREWPVADACRVSLYDADNFTDGLRGNTEAG